MAAFGTGALLSGALDYFNIAIQHCCFGYMHSFNVAWIYVYNHDMGGRALLKSFLSAVLQPAFHGRNNFHTGRTQSEGMAKADFICVAIMDNRHSHQVCLINLFQNQIKSNQTSHQIPNLSSKETFFSPLGVGK